MRQRSVNYFFGSLFSRQAIFAYGIAGGVTTVFQLLLLTGDFFGSMPTRTDTLPIFVELYIETLLPLWIPPITGWNIAMLIVNVMVMLLILGWWTAKYDRAF